MAGTDAIVLGAGVAGLSTALPLLRRGFRVTVIDPLPPAGGASFGNAGMVAADTLAPIALPGMLRQVPGWLTDPLGPLSVRPAYLPKAAPWLLRWIRAGRMETVLAIADVLRRLHVVTLETWRGLLGASYDALIRVAGHVHVWDRPQETASAAIERRLRERHGIAGRLMDREELARALPGVNLQAAQRAVFIPGNGQAIDPGRAVRRLAAAFQEEGGRILAERALKLVPEAGGWMILTNIDNHRADHVVVAAGAWSDTLLAPLGVSLPLESERGYHLSLPQPNLDLPHPILHKSRGFGLTSMEEGLRIAGTVEITGRDRAPNEARARMLLEQARQLFPDLAGGTPRLWMGCRPSTPDSLPVLGAVPGRPGLFLCFGHGHFGMTGGPPSGRLVAELISGERPFIDPAPFSITRFAGRATVPAAIMETRH